MKKHILFFRRGTSLSTHQQIFRFNFCAIFPRWGSSVCLGKALITNLEGASFPGHYTRFIHKRRKSSTIERKLCWLSLPCGRVKIMLLLCTTLDKFPVDLARTTCWMLTFQLEFENQSTQHFHKIQLFPHCSSEIISIIYTTFRLWGKKETDNPSHCCCHHQLLIQQVVCFRFPLPLPSPFLQAEQKTASRKHYARMLLLNIVVATLGKTKEKSSFWEVGWDAA